MLRRTLIFLLVASVLVLTVSWTAELGFHYKACTLCKLQRIPYLLILATGTFGLLSQHKLTTLKIIQGCLAAGLIISSYHTAVILGFIKDPCITHYKPTDIHAFKALLEAPLPCSASGWKLLQIPVSALNSFLSLALIITIQYAVKRETISSTKSDSS